MSVAIQYWGHTLWHSSNIRPNIYFYVILMKEKWKLILEWSVIWLKSWKHIYLFICLVLWTCWTLIIILFKNTKQQKMKCSELFVLFPTLARCDTRVALALREKETQVKWRRRGVCALKRYVKMTSKEEHNTRSFAFLGTVFVLFSCFRKLVMLILYISAGVDLMIWGP